MLHPSPRCDDYFRKTSTRRICGLLRMTAGAGKTSMCSHHDIDFAGLNAFCAHRRCASPSPMGKGDRQRTEKANYTYLRRRWMRFLLPFFRIHLVRLCSPRSLRDRRGRRPPASRLRGIRQGFSPLSVACPKSVGKGLVFSLAPSARRPLARGAVTAGD